MKMKTLLSTLSVAIMGMALLTSAAYAQGKGNKGERRHNMGQKIREKLNLTEQQTSQIKALREKFRQDNASSLNEIKALREQMMQAMKDKDKDKAKAVREQLKSKMESLKPAREQLRQQIGAILTPQQREQLAAMKAKRKEHREDRRGKWRDGKGGAAKGGEGNLD